MVKRLREKLAKGGIIFGTHIVNTELQQVELIGSCGFDYIWIDMEHSQCTNRDVHDMLIAARACREGVAALIRVPSIDPVTVKPLLEMGPAGIVFPGARSAKQAQTAVEACCYPPKGVRGFGPRACIRYGLDDMSEYVKRSDSSIFKVLQIETRGAYEQLDLILANDGLDAFILGPNDLAASFGHYRDWKHPEVMRVIDDIVERALAAGRVIGVSIGPYDMDTVSLWMQKGMRMISVGNENMYILNGCMEALGNLNRAVADTGR